MYECWFYYFVESVCIFLIEIDGDWYSVYKGKLIFNFIYLMGYFIYMFVVVQLLDFECYINLGRKYLLRYLNKMIIYILYNSYLF